ncbi:MAG: hypothetical protein ABFR75_13225 [Acidobacteriota bacterium]
MKKIILISIMTISLMGMSLFSADYKDAVPVLKVMTTSLEEFILSMEKAEDAKGIVSALDNYSKAVVEFAPDVRKMMKKYPELKDETTHPELLKPFTKKMEDLAKKLMKLFGKMAKYGDDPEVKEANKRWQKAMSSLKEKEKKEEETKEKEE